MNNLILVRHGQSLWNKERKFTGFMDIELTEKGKSEARHAGRLIKELNIKFDACFTSELKRAINSLNLILEVLDEPDVEINKAWELNERHYGSFTGMDKDEIKNKMGSDDFIKYRRSWDIAPPELSEKKFDIKMFGELNQNLPISKIPKTESLKDTYNRVVLFYKNEIKKHLENKCNVLVSAHGNSLRALYKYLFNISDNEIVNLEIPTGNPLLINFDSELKIQTFRYLNKKTEKKII